MSYESPKVDEVNKPGEEGVVVGPVAIAAAAVVAAAAVFVTAVAWVSCVNDEVAS